MKGDNMYIDDFVKEKLINHRVEPKISFNKLNNNLINSQISISSNKNLHKVQKYFTGKNIFFSIIVVSVIGAMFYFISIKSSEKIENIKSVNKTEFELKELRNVSSDSEKSNEETVIFPQKEITEKNVIIKKQIVVRDTLYIKDTVVIDK